MTVFVFLALIVVVSIIVSIVVATAVIRAPFFDLIGPFSAGLLGAAAYMLRDSAAFAAVLYDGHKYEQLLQICLAVLVVGFVAVWVGARRVDADIGA